MKCEVDHPVQENAETNTIKENVGKNYINELYYYKNNELKKISSSHFHDKYLGLFFGASWCKYCVTFIENIKFFKKNFPFVEIIYIPFDKTYNEYLTFLKKTDFYSLPFDNYLYICKKFQIKNLPSFVIIAPNNNVLVKDAVQLIKTDTYINNFKSLIKNYTIHPNHFKFGNRLFDLFCA
ncbi:thioredoxin-like redox-active protein [Plasmodium gonderi]|uniref:Thioredoxin-like redox-active protein n=1 Tax=Plasmodium gonderi TaxID=77519 RepID=A0A1Y1JIZ9_PLAGO|nr:thioredoxin-like redox-active protein [Plasmodium gonderi]GAW80782.1 thioredoxin-like redox-active protein [Plasmodium gonderi]